MPRTRGNPQPRRLPLHRAAYNFVGFGGDASASALYFFRFVPNLPGVDVDKLTQKLSAQIDAITTKKMALRNRDHGLSGDDLEMDIETKRKEVQDLEKGLGGIGLEMAREINQRWTPQQICEAQELPGKPFPLGPPPIARCPPQDTDL